MLDDTNLKYSDLELVFNKRIMDSLMSLTPPSHGDYLYFISLAKNDEKAREIMINKLELALEYSFINNNTLGEVELWNEALRTLYDE